LTQLENNGHDWAIVLTAGDGVHIHKPVEQWMGVYKPKPFGDLTGSSSILEHTWDRAVRIVGREHVVTLIPAEHCRYFVQKSEIPGKLIFVPADTGSSACIYLALACILSQDPGANIILLPAEHFIYPGSRFIHLARQALRHSHRHPSRFILLAAEPDWPNPDYAWIDIGHASPEAIADEAPCLLWQVSDFIEQPNLWDTGRLYLKGALRNTRIVATRAEALLHRLRIRHPGLSTGLADIIHQFAKTEQSQINLRFLHKELVMAFRDIPEMNIFQDLQHDCLVLPLKGVTWDDWGQLERLQQGIRRYMHWTTPSYPEA
jgi:mannose-1-phosphate guanylyltransferase